MFLGYNIDITPLDKAFVKEEPAKDNTEDIVFVTGEPKTTQEAKAEAVPSYESILREGYATGMSLPEIRQRATELGVKTEEMQRARDYHLEYALSLNNQDINAAETRLVTNIGLARDMISEKQFDLASDKSTTRRYYDATVMFVRDALPGVSTIEGFTGKSEDLSQEIQLAAATMPPDEFRKWFSVKIDDAMSKGAFITGNTLSSLDTLSSEVEMGGYDVNKNLNFLFSILDVVDLGAAGVASRASKNVFRRGVGATTKVGRAAAVEAPETVAEIAAKTVERNADPEIAANVGIKSLDPKPQPTDMPVNVLTKKATERELVKEITRRNVGGAFGRNLSEDEVVSLGETYVKRYRDATTDPVYNFKVLREDIGRLVAQVQIGKALPGKPSTPFKYTRAGNVPKSVQEMADNLGGNIVPVTEKSFVIQIDEALNPEDTIRAFTLPEDLPSDMTGLLGKTYEKTKFLLSSSLDNKWLGSSRVRDLEELTTLKQMAEAGLSGVKDVSQKYLKPIQSLSPKSRFTLSRIMSELRDNPKNTFKGEIGEVEFQTMWEKFHPKGTPPTEKDMAAYQAWAAIEDADYVFKSYNMYSRAVNKGFTQTIEPREGFFTPAIRVSRDSVPDNAKIIDGESGARLRKADFAEDDVFWRHMFATEDGQEYTVKPRSTRAISPEDILGVNPGGRRTNPRNRFYVIVSDGRQKMRALLGTFSETQAKRATQEIANIKRASDAGELTDEVIQANNHWNPNVQTVDDWDSLGLKTDDGDIHYKRSNGAVLDVVDETANPFFVDLSAEDFVRIQQSRSDEVLMQYGGMKSYNEDPVNTMLSSFGSSVSSYTNRLYTSKAMKGWVETAIQQRPEWFDKRVNRNDWYSSFVNAKVTGDDKFALKMSELRDIIVRRNGIKEPSASFMETLASKLAEYVFDIPGGQTLHDFLVRAGGIERVMLSLAFKSAFGFFNLSQFIVQGYHSIVASIVSLDHLAATMVIPLRLGHRITDPEALGVWASRMEKSYNALGANMSKQDWLDLHSYMKDAGRDVVEGDAIEAGTGVGWGISGWNGENMRYSALKGAMYNISKYGNKTIDASLMPFNSGERLSRMTVIVIAFREFRKKFPNVSPLSDEGKAWITRREQDLSINMSNASRSPIQSGLWKIPTQWLSYTMRAMEAVFIGRGLTKAERARMFMAMAPMFGLAGFGAESAADSIAEKLGIESESAYIGLKYGWLDGLSYALTGGSGGFSLGQRLAPVGAVKEVYQKITQESVYSALAGPSGEIAGSLVSPVWDLFTKSLPNATLTPITEDFIKILRQPSGIDTKFKAWSILSTGILRSKNGYVYDSAFTINDALTQLMGVTPIKATEEMQRSHERYIDDKAFKAFSKDIQKQAEVAFEYYASGSEKDIQKGAELFDYIYRQIEFSGLSPAQQLSIKKSILTPMSSNYQRIIDNLIRLDNAEGVKWAERILR